MIVRDAQKVDIRGMRGAPDWLAEVLSPSTASYDRRVKLPVYERVGVPEVWLVDPMDFTVSIYRLENGRYGFPEVCKLKGKMALTAIPDVSIDWDPLNLTMPQSAKR